jgi:hypothetical protein
MSLPSPAGPRLWGRAIIAAPKAYVRLFNDRDRFFAYPGADQCSGQSILVEFIQLIPHRGLSGYLWAPDLDNPIWRPFDVNATAQLPSKRGAQECREQWQNNQR